MRRWGSDPVALLGVYLLLRWGLSQGQLPGGTPGPVLLVAAAFSAAVSLGLPIAAMVAMVARPRPPVVLVGAILGGLALWLGLANLPLPRGALALSLALQDTGKILAAGSLGVLLGRALRDPNLLLPAGIFAAFADFVVVNFGTVKHALSSPQGRALVEKVSATVPALHARLPVLTIGPADFLFLGLFLACAARFGMGTARTAWVLGVVLVLSLVLVPVIGPIPALAPMSIAFVAVNWRHFRLSRQELIHTLIVLGLMGGLFLAYFLFLFPRKR
ncbi:MAG: hypothetical protein FJX77_06945 [Armatimonadetes bacterium]|nr:hypothetical protein [Armatimonadota bacterium]